MMSSARDNREHFKVRPSNRSSDIYERDHHASYRGKEIFQDKNDLSDSESQGSRYYDNKSPIKFEKEMDRRYGKRLNEFSTKSERFFQEEKKNYSYLRRVSDRRSRSKSPSRRNYKHSEHDSGRRPRSPPQRKRSEYGSTSNSPIRKCYRSDRQDSPFKDDDEDLSDSKYESFDSFKKTEISSKSKFFEVAKKESFHLPLKKAINNEMPNKTEIDPTSKSNLFKMSDEATRKDVQNAGLKSALKNKIIPNLGLCQQNLQIRSFSESDFEKKSSKVRDLPIYSDDELISKNDPNSPNMAPRKEERFFFQTNTGQDLRSQLLERALAEKKKLGLENLASSKMTSALEALQCYSPETHSPSSDHIHDNFGITDDPLRSHAEVSSHRISSGNPGKSRLKTKIESPFNLPLPSTQEKSKGTIDMSVLSIPGLGFDDIDDIDKFLYGENDALDEIPSVGNNIQMEQNKTIQESTSWSDDDADYLLPYKKFPHGMQKSRTPSPVPLRSSDKLLNTQTIHEDNFNQLTNSKMLNQNSSDELTIDLKLQTWKNCKENLIEENLNQKMILKDSCQKEHDNDDLFIERAKENKYLNKNNDKYVCGSNPNISTSWKANSSLYFGSKFKQKPGENLKSLPQEAAYLEQNKKTDCDSCEIPLPSFHYKENVQQTSSEKKYFDWKEKTSVENAYKNSLNEIVPSKEKVCKEDLNSAKVNFSFKDTYTKMTQNFQEKNFTTDERYKTESNLKRAYPHKDSVESRSGWECGVDWIEKSHEEPSIIRDRRQYENTRHFLENCGRSSTERSPLSCPEKRLRSPHEDSLEKKSISPCRKSPERIRSPYRDLPEKNSPRDYSDRWNDSPRHISAEKRMKSPKRDIHNLRSRSPVINYNRSSRRDSLGRRERSPSRETFDERLISSRRDFSSRSSISPMKESRKSPEWKSPESSDRSPNEISPEIRPRISVKFSDERWKSPRRESLERDLSYDMHEKKMRRESPSRRSPVRESFHRSPVQEWRSPQRTDFKEGSRQGFGDSSFHQERTDANDTQVKNNIDISLSYQSQQSNYYTDAQASANISNSQATLPSESHYHQQQAVYQQGNVQQPAYPFTSTNTVYGTPESFMPYGMPPPYALPHYPLPPFPPPLPLLSEQNQFSTSRTNLKVIPLQEDPPKKPVPTNEKKANSYAVKPLQSPQKSSIRNVFSNIELKVSLSPQEYKQLLNYKNEQKKQYEIFVKELERLNKIQGDMMRKMQKTKDGHKDTLILEASKLQEEVSSQMKDLRKKMDATEKMLQRSSKPPGASLPSDVKSESTSLQVKEHVPKTRNEDKTEGSEVCFAYFDPGNHWCKQCNEVFSSAYKLLKHLQSIKHKQNLDPYERPWKSETCKFLQNKIQNAKLAKASFPFKGAQFLMPTLGYYCTLCKTSLVDILSAEDHLISPLHNQNYSKFISGNPVYERRWNLDKEAGLSIIEREAKKKLRDIEKHHDNTKRQKKEDIEKQKHELIEADTRISNEIKELDEEQTLVSPKCMIQDDCSEMSKSKGIKLTLLSDKTKIEKQKIDERKSAKETKPVQLVYIGRAPNFRSMITTKRDSKASGFGKFSWKKEKESMEKNTNSEISESERPVTSSSSEISSIKTISNIETLHSQNMSTSETVTTTNLPNTTVFPLRKKKNLKVFGPEPMPLTVSEKSNSTCSLLPSEVDIAKAFAGTFASNEDKCGQVSFNKNIDEIKCKAKCVESGNNGDKTVSLGLESLSSSQECSLLVNKIEPASVTSSCNQLKSSLPVYKIPSSSSADFHHDSSNASLFPSVSPSSERNEQEKCETKVVEW